MAAEGLAGALLGAAAYAFALYLALLAGLLASAGIAARRRARRLAHLRASDPGAVYPLLLRARALGIGVAVMLFVLTALAVTSSPAAVRLDEALALAVHRATPAPLLQAFAVLTHLGDTLTLTVVCAAVGVALLRFGERALALAWVAAVAGNGLLNVTLKAAIGRTRPLLDDPYLIAHGWSFPSGHTSGSVVTYGMLAYVAVVLLPPRQHQRVLLAAVTLAYTVAASRVFLHVHYPADVVGGMASGSAWLLMCIAAYERWGAQGRVSR